MFGHFTYIVFELGWALPILILHWVVGHRILWPRLRLLLVATAVSTLYLSLADSIALRAGIWTLHAPRILGLQFGNLPIEEAIFFGLTDLLVVQTIILLLKPGETVS